MLTPRRQTPADRIERLRSLDRPANAIRNRVHRILRREATRDALHGVWLGHPLHPPLAQVPLGAWMSAAVLDLLPGAHRCADVLLGVGLVASVPAAAAGLADFADLHRQQMRVGVVHAAANGVATSFFTASLAARLAGRRGLGRGLSTAGLAVVGASAYLGGHLAYRQAAGANHAEDVQHLIDPEWHPVARMSELADGVPTARLVHDVPVVLLRRGVHVDALAGRCSHLSGPLSEGDVVQDGAGPALRCPWHGTVFRLADGAVVHGPATSPQPRFEVWVADGTVRVRLPAAG